VQVGSGFAVSGYYILIFVTKQTNKRMFEGYDEYKTVSHMTSF